MVSKIALPLPQPLHFRQRSRQRVDVVDQRQDIGVSSLRISDMAVLATPKGCAVRRR